MNESMRAPEEKFILTAIAFTLTAGAGLGAWYLALLLVGRPPAAGHHSPMLNIHTQVQIFGWVGLFIMGMAYIIIPRFKASPLHSRTLEDTSYVLMSVGVVAWAAAVLAVSPWVALLAATAETLGAVIFGYNLLRTMLRGQSFLWDKFVYAALLWFVAASAYGLYLLPLTITGLAGRVESVRHIYYLVVFFGFMTNFIMGVGLRTLPVFLGVRRANAVGVTAVFVIANSALGVLALPLVGISVPPVAASLATWGLLASVAGFVAIAYVFANPEADLGGEFAVETSYMNYLPAAYGWLLVGLGILAFGFVAPLSEAGRDAINSAAFHALGFGFVTGMIFGYGSKALPVVKGRSLYSPPLNNLTFYVYQFGTAGRVFALLGIGLGVVSLTPIAALSGLAQFAAVAMFSYNVFRTLVLTGSAQDIEVADFSKVGPQTVVHDVLVRHPQTLEVFLSFGFKPLANPMARATLARTVSIRTAARMAGVDEPALLSSLNRAIDSETGKEGSRVE